MLFGRHVNKYYLKYLHMFLLGFIALLIVDYFQLLIPEMIGKLINNIQDETLTKGYLQNFLLKLVGIGIIMFVGRFAWRIGIFGVGIRIEKDIRREMFIHSEKLSQRYYSDSKIGGLMALYINDINAVRRAFSNGLIMIVDIIFLGGLTLYKMGRLDLTLTLVSSIPLIAILSFSAYIHRVMHSKFLLRQKAFEQLSEFTQEDISGITVIKAFVKRTNQLKQFSKLNKENKELNINFARYYMRLDVLLNLVISLIVILIMAVGAYAVYRTIGLSNDDPNKFKVGDLTTFIAYFGTLIWPIMAIGDFINLNSQASASLERINELLDEKIDIVDKDVVEVNLEDVEASIEFRNFNFMYPRIDDKTDEQYGALHDISFKINSGESVGVIGRTGCGKTTLVNTLLRLYNVEDNTLFIGGYDINRLPFKLVRELVGYVPQDNFLFSDSIKENIGFSRKDYSEQQVIDAAIFADVHENIQSFKEKYETILGERGVTISGGQKQRVSIARAILKNPKILVLDDSVSAVDVKTEEIIINNIKKQRHGQTTILIAHRISTVSGLDKIVLLDQGKLVAVGSHQELLKNCPLYLDMVNRQKLEEELEGN